MQSSLPLLVADQYRSTSGGTYTKVNPSPITGTSYGDADLPRGTHTYLLRAVDTFGLGSGPSETASASISSSSSSGCFVTVARGSGLPRNIDIFILLSVFLLGLPGRNVVKRIRNLLGFAKVH